MRLIIFGAPGSGKGTQVSELSAYYKVKKISLGDILREEVKGNTPLGNIVKGYMESGLLVPDDIVAQVLEDNLTSQSFIIDGYPRNIEQARHLDNIFKKLDKELDAVIYLEVDKDTALKRLENRRVCRECGANYHLINMPPKDEGICDVCSKGLAQRDDDKAEVISKRWEVFLKESAPLLGFYRKMGKLVTLDARGHKDIVLDKLKQIIDNGKYSKL